MEAQADDPGSLAAGRPKCRPFVLVTGNPGKQREAERILGYPVETEAVDLPEIQELDMEIVLRAKADEAWSRLRRPLVVEETGLELSGLNGFPGPLVKWLLAAVGPEGIARMGMTTGDPGVAAVCSVLYRDGDGEIVASGRTHGELVLPGRGDQGFGWDPVFQPEGETQTYGELPAARKDEIGHRGRAWRALLAAMEGSS